MVSRPPHCRSNLGARKDQYKNKHEWEEAPGVQNTMAMTKYCGNVKVVDSCEVEGSVNLLHVQATLRFVGCWAFEFVASLLDPGTLRPCV